MHAEHYQPKIPRAAKVWNIGKRCTAGLLKVADSEGHLAIEKCHLPTRRSQLVGAVIIEDEQAALQTARTHAGSGRMALWTDGSKLEDGRAGCAVA